MRSALFNGFPLEQGFARNLAIDIRPTYYLLHHRHVR